MRKLLFIAIGLIATGCGRYVSTQGNAELSKKYSSNLKYVQQGKLVSENQFHFGVASGDPLTDRVVIWTKVSHLHMKRSKKPIECNWVVGLSVGETGNIKDTVAKGKAIAYYKNDFCVKVDVKDLKPGTTYYYRFNVPGGWGSPWGRTKTLPANPTEVTLGFVSCSNYEAGFFAPYRILAGSKYDDLSAVVHLGDYIYEYGTKVYADTTLGRFHLPKHELTSLQDYRLRYATYRTDKDLQMVHRMHPMITTWDDHESANNSYVDGAQNHHDNEGKWSDRKRAARKAYLEWLPVRETDDTKLYRSFKLGELANLIILDTRLEGRTKQVDSISDPNLYSADRTILGKTQRDWFIDELKSPQQWKIVGNQVLFSYLRSDVLGYSELYMDGWDGYPAEKEYIMNEVYNNKIQNLVMVTGDYHSSFAQDIMFDVYKYPELKSKGSIGVELLTPSVSSPNIDERKPKTVRKLEKRFFEKNPQLRYVNLRDHGFVYLKINKKYTEAQFIMGPGRHKSSEQGTLDRSFRISSGSSSLKFRGGLK